MSAATLIVHNFSGTNCYMGAGSIGYSLPPGRTEIKFPYDIVTLSNSSSSLTLDLPGEGTMIGVFPAHQFEARVGTASMEYLGHGMTPMDLGVTGVLLGVSWLGVGLMFAMMRTMFRSGGIGEL